MSHPLVVLNTSIVTTDGTYALTPVTLAEARTLAQGSRLDSAVGHEATAQLLTRLLGVPIRVNRQQFAQAVGQRALVCKLNARPPEGRILTEEEMEAIGFTLKILERLA